jgi:imidazolonepropionase-like amidohydrolase
MFEAFFLDHPQLADMMPKVQGAEGARRLVRANIERGVDHIKILATERGGTPNTDPRRRTWSDEELAAIIDEAKKGGLAVTAHAHADGGAVAAIRAGVREINHGSFLNDETLALMKASGTFLLTTLAVGDTVPASMAQQDPKFWERVLEFKRESASVAARASKMGLLLVAGTDGDYKSAPGFTIVSELSALVKAGVPPMEAIKAATSRAAESLRISQRTGSIKPGLEADLIAVAGDPLKDIEALGRPVLIVNDGHVTLEKLK